MHPVKPYAGLGTTKIPAENNQSAIIFRAGPLRGGCGYRVPKPGPLSGGLRSCYTQRGLGLVVTRFVLVQAFRPRHRFGDRNWQLVGINLKKKKGGRPPITISADVLPRGAGNISHNSSLVKCSDLFQNFQTLPGSC